MSAVRTARRGSVRCMPKVWSTRGDRALVPTLQVMAMIRPDVLVLDAGGIVGEAWMTGVLRGLTESTGIDFRTCDYYVGTSAGSIVAASLAAGREPRAPTGRHTRHQEAARAAAPPPPPRPAGGPRGGT